ncbi:methylated-DNA--[protein]-cysteine S-methyltransferase [Alcanivorax sp. S6407]|uniref:bifunctional transcriptional activator/DNA repair enzyme AdaA n=1 Tax=Alcanivorax sp. S6407 TaxID=2926424 RepID=UPI001FF35380|nr:methylated-DNA--[protein]-cysteine S-methyltransferase [Alcanivorax sp. S6407]MCK0152535.1 methylated-DNA--[protein]-cysteine S-methyltransferase [Alcanivorax sp. S6407]
MSSFIRLMTTPAVVIAMNNDQQLDLRRWEILSSRAPCPDTPFFYGVITTGILCRPGCPSRRPRQENVRFFDHYQDGLEAGYRPCKRCHPLDDNHPDNVLASRIAEWIAAHPEDSDLKSLAAAMNYTSAHLHKVFSKVTGLSPFKYAKVLRQQRVYASLGSSQTSTEVMEKAGYRSSSQFYDEFRQFSSLPPGSHRQAGKGEVITFAAADTSLGSLVIAASAKGLCWISLGEDVEKQVDDLQRHFANACFCPPDEGFNHWISQVAGLVEDPARSLDLPLDIRGTVFQCQVWEALRQIPVGSTLDYQQLADRIGKPGGARAVARACATNVLALAVPCHRIIRRDGSLSGYRWGVERKAALLKREKRSR